MTGRRLARLAALVTVWAGVELLERIAYRAGVLDAGAAAGEFLADVAEAVDDLISADVSDVVAAHADCCPLVVAGSSSWQAVGEGMAS